MCVHDPSSCHPVPVCSPPRVSVSKAQTYDLLLKTEHGESDGMCVIMYKWVWNHFTQVYNIQLAGVSLSFTDLEDASDHVGKLHMQRNYGRSLGAEGSLHLTASKKLKPSVLQL